MGARTARTEKTQHSKQTSSPRQRKAKTVRDATLQPAQNTQKTTRTRTAKAVTAANTAASHAKTAQTKPVRLKHDLPAVVSCPNLTELQALAPDEARHHVDAYLHEVMTTEEADDFEALSYHWELHLVAIDQLCLLRTVEVARGKLRTYRAAIRRGSTFPPLVGLGGDGKEITEQVLLCDGYHRVMAMRELGIHFAWVWLAAGRWEQPTSTNLAPLLACGV